MKFCTKNEYYGLNKLLSDQEAEIDNIRNWKNGVEDLIKSIAKSTEDLQNFGMTIEGMKRQISKCESQQSKQDRKQIAENEKIIKKCQLFDEALGMHSVRLQHFVSVDNDIQVLKEMKATKEQVENLQE